MKRGEGMTSAEVVLASMDRSDIEKYDVSNICNIVFAKSLKTNQNK